MKVTITLGVAFAEHRAPVEINTLLHTDVGELDPNVFFDALQRVGSPDPSYPHLDADLDRIRAKYSEDKGYHFTLAISLTHLRRLMERRGAPSMSVGDTIDYWSSPGGDEPYRVPILRSTCEPVGWTHGPIPAVESFPIPR